MPSIRPVTSSVGQHTPLWALLLALLGVAALLVIFELVVQQAVRQGEQRRSAESARAHAVWRCNALKDHQARVACRLGVDSTDPAALQARR